MNTAAFAYFVYCSKFVDKIKLANLKKYFLFLLTTVTETRPWPLTLLSVSYETKKGEKSNQFS